MSEARPRPQNVIESNLIQYAMSDGLKIDKHHTAFRFRFVDRSFVSLAYARDPGLSNAVLNVFFDPLTAKRRSFKDIMGEKRKPKKKRTNSWQNGVNKKWEVPSVGGWGGCT